MRRPVGPRATSLTRQQPPRRRVVGFLAAAALLASGACTTGSVADPAPPMTRTPRSAVATSTDPQAPLVVETVFDHTTLDPPRQYDRSGLMLSKALYETLTTYDGTDQTRPRGGLADYTMSPEGNWLTLRLQRDRVFSDGTPITSDDVIFSLERAQGLRGAAASLLGNVTIRRIDDRTVTITSSDANFALPAVLANPAFAVLNSRLVRAHGGTIGPGDTADTFLATTSAGSGPYVISGADAREVRLTVSPTWEGARPAFPEVVVRDRTPQAQVDDVTSGAADVVLDLSPDQADRFSAEAVSAAEQTPSATAGGSPAPAASATVATSDVTAMAARSATTAFLMLSRDPKVNAWTADPSFAEAVRLGIDRTVLSEQVRDSLPAAGLVPAGILGSLLAPLGTPTGALADAPTATATTPESTDGTGAAATEPPSSATPRTPSPGATTSAPTPIVPARDLPSARAALARSGYAGQVIPLAYAPDLPIQGVPTAAVASAVADQLAEVGITVRPTPLPSATALARYRDGRDGLSLWSWTPDYPDPENYLAFAPGGLIGLRAGWRSGVDPHVDDLTDEARMSVGADRPMAYAAWQRALDVAGPFVPLFQPSSHLAHGPRVTDLPTHPVWTLDLAGIT